MALYLIRYGELGLKSQRVRSRFEMALRDNIISRFITASKECRIESERGRIFLWADDETFAHDVLSKTFGIVSFSKSVETTSDVESIFKQAIETARPLFKEGIEFAVRARRHGQHHYTSMELGKETGSAIFLAFQHLNPVVNLTNPELEIFVEVRQNRTFLYTGKTQGPGGMPLGTQGLVLGLVESPRDIAACWPIMKRGCRVIIATDKPELTLPLNSWDPDLKIVESGNLQEIAYFQRTEGITLGWSPETFDARQNELAKFDLPVFFPLIGLGDAEIQELMERIGA